MLYGVHKWRTRTAAGRLLAGRRIGAETQPQYSLDVLIKLYSRFQRSRARIPRAQQSPSQQHCRMLHQQHRLHVRPTAMQDWPAAAAAAWPAPTLQPTHRRAPCPCREHCLVKQPPSSVRMCKPASTPSHARVIQQAHHRHRVVPPHACQPAWTIMRDNACPAQHRHLAVLEPAAAHCHAPHHSQHQHQHHMQPAGT